VWLKYHTHTYQLQHVFTFWHYRDLQHTLTVEGTRRKERGTRKRGQREGEPKRGERRRKGRREKGTQMER
jgi:hypothetical protein